MSGKKKDLVAMDQQEKAMLELLIDRTMPLIVERFVTMGWKEQCLELSKKHEVKR